jgi:GntR family transcriptional regulator
MESQRAADRLLAELRLEASGVPIYVQLRDQVLRALAVGLLAPGDQMPTMRQVAVALKVDLNTVRHAYEALDRAGAIRLERGRGSFVSQPPPAAADQDPLDALARRTLSAATAQGLSAQALIQKLIQLSAQAEDLP